MIWGDVPPGTIVFDDGRIEVKISDRHYFYISSEDSDLFEENNDDYPFSDFSTFAVYPRSLL